MILFVYNKYVKSNLCRLFPIPNPFHHPYGMMMPDRDWSSESGYRFGFGGKENISSNSDLCCTIDFENRIYNPLIGNFASIDPFYRIYLWVSPYIYSERNPIAYVDLDGLERYYAANGQYIGNIGGSTQIKVLTVKGMIALDWYLKSGSNPDYVTSFESYYYHDATPEVQSAISQTIYNDMNHVSEADAVRANDLSNEGNPAMSTNLENDNLIITVNSQKQYKGEYLNDDYNNQISTFYHEDKHINRMRKGLSPGIDAFTHFDIGYSMMKNSPSFQNSTDNFKEWTFQRNVGGYIADQKVYLATRLFEAASPVDEYNSEEFQSLLNRYRLNIKIFNEISPDFKIQEFDLKQHAVAIESE